jgi:hypothetical protein
MKLTARRLFLVFLVLGAGALLSLLWLENSYQDGPNYSLIEEGLYLGGRVKEPPPGTEAVLNLCENEDPYRLDIHLWEAIPDSEPAPSLDWLRRAVAFVDGNRKAGRTTYVHCRQGVSRGGMVVTAYLMAKNRWTRDQALEYVRASRPQVRPNPAFMGLLLEWERVVRDE